MDPDLFHPSHPQRDWRQVLAAKQICAGCPVTAECLAMALAVEDGPQQTRLPRVGIYGGLTPAERARL